MLKDAEVGLLRMLKERRARTDIRHVLPEAVYRNKEDLLLHHGHFYPPQALPKRYRRRRARACFDNAYRLAVRAGLRYAEGVAITSAGSFPIDHAWCVDATGRAVDPTWATLGVAYFGVEFSLDRVAATQTPDEMTIPEAPTSVLDDWMRHWPALRERYDSANL